MFLPARVQLIHLSALLSATTGVIQSDVRRSGRHVRRVSELQRLLHGEPDQQQRPRVHPGSQRDHLRLRRSFAGTSLFAHHQDQVDWFNVHDSQWYDVRWCCRKGEFDSFYCGGDKTCEYENIYRKSGKRLSIDRLDYDIRLV